MHLSRTAQNSVKNSLYQPTFQLFPVEPLKASSNINQETVETHQQIPSEKQIIQATPKGLGSPWFRAHCFAACARAAPCELEPCPRLICQMWIDFSKDKILWKHMETSPLETWKHMVSPLDTFLVFFGDPKKSRWSGEARSYTRNCSHGLVERENHGKSTGNNQGTSFWHPHRDFLQIFYQIHSVIQTSATSYTVNLLWNATRRAKMPDGFLWAITAAGLQELLAKAIEDLESTLSNEYWVWILGWLQ